MLIACRACDERHPSVAPDSLIGLELAHASGLGVNGDYPTEPICDRCLEAFLRSLTWRQLRGYPGRGRGGGGRRGTGTGDLEALLDRKILPRLLSDRRAASEHMRETAARDIAGGLVEARP